MNTEKEPIRTPLRVLILEDLFADAELMMRELRRAGYELTWQWAETRQDFVDGLESKPDLVLADYALPEFDGLHALKLMQDRGLDIPFIIVSGVIGEELAVAAMKQGAADYLLKDRLARLGPAVMHALQAKEIREEKRQAEQALRYLGTHDALTALFNRAFFEAEFARFKAGRQFPVSVVMADVDDLKAINDQLGHATGDGFLRRAAAVFKDSFRSEDIVARIGGDEFAALLPLVSAATAQELLCRVRTSLHEHNRRCEGLPLRLSLGAATADEGDDLDAALIQADRQMYGEKAKNGK